MVWRERNLANQCNPLSGADGLRARGGQVAGQTEILELIYGCVN